MPNTDTTIPQFCGHAVTDQQLHLIQDLVDQCHYLGHNIPFGAHLRYLIQSQCGLLGCLQYASPA